MATGEPRDAVASLGCQCILGRSRPVPARAAHAVRRLGVIGRYDAELVHRALPQALARICEALAAR
jgi:hypothetical protein